MNSKDLILVVVAIRGGSSALGRTLLQKLSYFAGLALDIDLGHRAYYYGPFSESVVHDVEVLALSGLIEETVQSLGFVNQDGFVGRQFNYQLTEAGRSRVNAVKEAHPVEFEEIERLIANLASDLSGLDQATLSTAAKVTYLLRQEGHELSGDEVTELASAQGWQVPGTAVERVQKVAEQYGGGLSTTRRS